MKISEIINGYKNYLMQRDLPKELKDLSEVRFRHCASCTLFENGICNPLKEGVSVKTGNMTKGCGCVLKVKVLSQESKCPLEKW